MVKVTFTLDELTVRQLRRTAARVGQPQSRVVRAAIQEYASRVGKLSEGERIAFLRVFDTLVPKISVRPQAQVEAELRAIRAARRKSGRRHPVA